MGCICELSPILLWPFNARLLIFLRVLMFKIMRKVVAGPKRTTNYQGNQLDLTYISERIIAMAFPASDILQKTYRNKIEDVSSYFSENHGENYLVINVSSRIYDYDLFEGRVMDFEWVDHQAPTLPVLIRVGYEMYEFLRGKSWNIVGDKSRVVAVHCNHGKGRTGTAIISFFLLIGYSHSAVECLKFYNCRRFNKETYGVDQPCQVRYLNFIQKLMQAPTISKKLPCFHLKLVTHKGLNQNYYIRIKSTKTQQIIYDKILFNEHIHQSPNKFLMSDIFIELFLDNWMGQRRISRINYNLYFMENDLTITFKGSNIKIDHGHSKEFEMKLQFQYHCLCHLPTYNETICTCNYMRNIWQLEWSRMVDSIRICKKLTDDQISVLVHGYKNILHEQNEQQFQRNSKNEDSQQLKASKIFKNHREQKLYALSQNKKTQNQYYSNQEMRSSKQEQTEEIIQDQAC